MSIEKITKTIKKLEKTPIGRGHWVITFFSIVYLRVLLEGILESQHRIGYSTDPLTGSATIIHYVLAFTVYYLSILLIIKITGWKLIRLRPLIRISLLCTPVIIIPPLIDALVTGGDGYHLYYHFQWKSFLVVVLNSFNPFTSLPGISHGQRIEVFLVCLGSAVYLYLSNSGILKSILCFTSIYLTLCLYEFLPSIIGSIARLFIKFEQSGGLSAGQELMLRPNDALIVYQAHLRFAFVYLIIFVMLLVLFWIVDSVEQRTSKEGNL